MLEISIVFKRINQERTIALLQCRRYGRQRPCPFIFGDSKFIVYRKQYAFVITELMIRV